MARIFHERQDGALCAQHALNCLLQGPYFTAVDLAEIARQLDEQERSHMAEFGVNTREYLEYISQESGNYDDSGFFSSQVISKALTTFGLDISPIGSRDNQLARNHPERFETNLPYVGKQRTKSLEGGVSVFGQAAFVCWLNAHWFVIRKMECGGQWFNLDSNLPEPKPVSELYLQLLLQEMQAQGYTVFVVKGELPRVSSSEAFTGIPAPNLNPEHTRGVPQSSAYSVESSAESSEGFLDEELQAAIAMSLAGTDNAAPPLQDNPTAIVPLGNVARADSDGTSVSIVGEMDIDLIEIAADADVSAATDAAAVIEVVDPIDVSDEPTATAADTPTEENRDAHQGDVVEQCSIEELRRRRVARFGSK